MISNETLKELSKLAFEMRGCRLTPEQKEAFKAAIDKAETFPQLIAAMLVAGWASRNNSNNQSPFSRF